MGLKSRSEHIAEDSKLCPTGNLPSSSSLYLSLYWLHCFAEVSPGKCTNFISFERGRGLSGENNINKGKEKMRIVFGKDNERNYLKRKGQIAGNGL
jgi:hypothetical protein